MNTSRLAVLLTTLLTLAACGAKKGGTAADGGAAAATSGSAAAAASGPAYHCLKKSIARCEQTTEAQLAAAKAKMEAGTADEKKFAGFMTLDGFKALCDKGEYGDGACATANAVGACTGITGKTLYYSGADGYKADDFAYECGKDSTPESMDGKALPKPASPRMSCFRSKDKTCIEDEYKGKSSKIGFCTADSFMGPAEFALTPCPADKRSGVCKDKPMNVGGTVIETSRVTYAYGAPAAAKQKSMCTIMKNEWTKL